MNWADRIRAARGRAVLSTVWPFKLFFEAVGLRDFYAILLARFVERTGLFDGSYYIEHHPDLEDLEISPIHHYAGYGDQEGRSPMAFFDPMHYRAHASGNTKYISAILHYKLVGRYERVSPSPWFDLNYYLNENDDVARSGVDPLLHYLHWGGLEGRSPSADFDGAYYLRSNPDVMQARMNPLLHYLLGGRFQGRPARPRVPHQGNQTSETEAANLFDAQAWEGLERRSGRDDVPIDVIVPVYKGRVETLACLHSVLAAPVETQFELVVVNDASPDVELAEDLRRLADDGLLTLEENAANLGFVSTVNIAMALHESRDVVVLNADTEVYDNWLDRLRAAALRHPKTGTVTPLSNNATICSYPRFLHDNPYLLELPYATLDGLTAEVNGGIEVEAPTGVGFCLYVRRDCLDAIGAFDAVHFGKGYGEENDFCQRAIAAGWRNVIAADIFVRHWGGTSFEGETAKRINKAMEVMDRLHPRYIKDVTDFIERDPLAAARARLDWARLLRMRQRKNVLIVCHNRGGGTERHVQEDVARLLRAGYGVFFMRPARTDKARIVFGHPALKFSPNLQADELRELDGLTQKLQALGIGEIHTHSLVDFEPESPRFIHELVRRISARWEVNLHDYKVVCPRISLSDSKGRYCGEPNEEGCNQCLLVRGSSFGVRNIRWWRNMHWQALEAADEVLVPDEDMSLRLERYFPGLEITVSPHEQIKLPPPPRGWQPAHDGGKVHVVVIGAINKHKGIDVLLSCARYARKRRLPLRFSVLGYTSNDNAIRREGIDLIGRYQDEDAVERLKALCPDIVWLPSIWPETYSYTLSIALETNRPIAAFDLGAIAARLRRIDRAHFLMPLSLVEHPAKVNARLLGAVRGGRSPSSSKISAGA